LPEALTIIVEPAEGPVRAGGMSYVYLRWAISDNNWIDPIYALLETYVTAMIEGNIDEDLIIERRGDDLRAPNTELIGWRIREGVEGFYISDINNPAASTRA
jgi:hypothetical protein